MTKDELHEHQRQQAHDVLCIFQALDPEGSAWSYMTPPALAGHIAGILRTANWEDIERAIESAPE